MHNAINIRFEPMKKITISLDKSDQIANLCDLNSKLTLPKKHILLREMIRLNEKNIIFSFFLTRDILEDDLLLSGFTVTV
jgi:hypothetical protein